MTSASDSAVPAFWAAPTGRRVPRIALMGEFSAGKSTLANLMIGSGRLPEQVVATQLPPVWVSGGSQDPLLVDLEGNETPCDVDALQSSVRADTAFIRIFSTDEILTKCEIIDMPGISDPNMASIVWERVLPYADGVIWCTPATQAWRQSEAAVWEDIDETIRQKSILVVTRADMLLTEHDRKKVFRRVMSEAGALFSDVTMMSLTQARDAKDDDDLWAKSGADDFVSKFLKMLDCISAGLPSEDPSARVPDLVPQETVAVAGETPEQTAPRDAALRSTRLQAKPESDAAAPDPVSFMPKFS